MYPNVARVRQLIRQAIKHWMTLMYIVANSICLGKHTIDIMQAALEKALKEAHC
jgi:hypothetical protein